MKQRILIGTRKGTFFAEKTGGSWSVRLAGHHGAGVNFVARDPKSGTLWAALGHGHWGAKLSRSLDGGESWEDAPQLAYPPGARHYIPPPPSDSGPGEGAPTLKEATLLKLWCMAFGSDGRIWCGTIPGGLFSSTDGGESFELCRGLWDHPSRGGALWQGEGTGETMWYGTPAAEGEFAPGLHSIEIDPRDPNHIYIAVSTAGVFETTDGGTSWEVRNDGLEMEYAPDPTATWAGHDPHAIQLSAAEPDHIWMQNHCGVFYSNDGAKVWSKVSAPERGVNFGFPVVVDPKDGKTAWLVPGHSDMKRVTVDGSLFVARTSDGGQSWEQLRKGLPQACAYDVVYRHAFDLGGDSLSFGTTTGNLYVSDDRGDTWTSLASNLPPVYSVRFA